MTDLVFLIPLFPLLGFLVNGLGWRTIPKNIGGIIGSLTVLASFAVSLGIFLK
jgi:NADH-quinone oxidoreductase subunit L